MTHLTYRELRWRRGVSQARLAMTVGVARDTVRLWELGYRQPRDNQLVALAAALDVPVASLPFPAYRHSSLHVELPALSDMLPPDAVHAMVRAGLAHYQLTPTEQRVAWAVLRGLSNPEISAELGFAHSTVKNVLNTAMARTGSSTRIQFTLRLLGIDPATMRDD